ncbi:hypothetical protein BT69DRAFT_1283262 [Atractiella rhizophila]|nr:hypothetical protein BT69DRAFT_1283262 [Atractiella rhizophila]
MSSSRHASRSSQSRSSHRLSLSTVPPTPKSSVSFASSSGDTEYFNPPESLELAPTPTPSPPESNESSTETEREDASPSRRTKLLTRVASHSDDETEGPEEPLDELDDRDERDRSRDREEEEEEDVAWWYDGLEDGRQEVWNEERERGRRRVYGGGREQEIFAGGELHWTEVGCEIIAICLPPVVFSLPYALDLLGGHAKLFIPILLIAAFGSWFTLVLISMQVRYTGSLSFPGLAKSVFPYGSWLAKLGEIGVELWRGGTEWGRATVGFMGACDLVQQLMKHWFPHAPVLRTRVFVVVFLSLCLMLTPPIKSLFIPRQPVLPPHASSRHRHYKQTAKASSGSLFSLQRLPTLFVLTVYSAGLLIFGLRPRKLQEPSIDDPSLPLEKPDILHNSSWGAICLALATFAPHPHAFSLLRSLRRTPSNKRASMGGADAFSNIGFGRRKRILRKLRSDRWELACFSGLVVTFGLATGWAVVGWHVVGGSEGMRSNVLLSPAISQPDGWMDVLRVGMVLATLSNLRRILQPTSSFLARAGWWAFQSRREEGYEPILQPQVRKRKSQKMWKMLAWLTREVLVWGSLAAVAICWSEGMVSLGELVGGFGVALNSWLTPAFHFIILFHVRKARSIFISPTSPTSEQHPSFDGEHSSDPAGSQDSLLMHKERELQRRLSGRRMWQDFGVFGGIAPGSIVVVAQTIASLATKS